MKSDLWNILASYRLQSNATGLGLNNHNLISQVLYLCNQTYRKKNKNNWHHFLLGCEAHFEQKQKESLKDQLILQCLLESATQSSPDCMNTCSCKPHYKWDMETQDKIKQQVKDPHPGLTYFTLEYLYTSCSTNLPMTHCKTKQDVPNSEPLSG